MTGKTFLVDLHTKYIKELDTKQHELEYWMTEHLRLNGVYWGLTALTVLGRMDVFDREEVVSYVISCQQENGGFGGHPGHDAHLLYTYSAIQILCIYDAMDRVDVDAVAAFIKTLYTPERGSWVGDQWGEEDTRFAYCSVGALSLLGRLDKGVAEKTTEYILSCQNLDGGFGCVPGAESHAAQVFCCLAALSVCGTVDRVEKEALSWWLCERQLPCGGLNGRPEKKEDVCYSWWVLSSLSILGKVHWIDADKLIEFILECQDEETGGIADRPGDYPDVFHTLFGLAGLSLLGYKGLQPINPVYCMPPEALVRAGILQ